MTIKAGAKFYVHRDGHYTYRVPGEGRYPVASDYRPVVVLDPIDLDLEGVVECLRETGLFNGTVLALQSQLKPDEPTGLGAVVRDVRGRLWVKSVDTDGGSWCTNEARWAGWSHVDAVEVLSPGVPVE